MKSNPPGYHGLSSRLACPQAYSLVELLVAVSVIALAASIAIPSVGSVRTAVARAKLASDVAILNQAVKLYVAEGGRVDNLTTSDEVIAHLKTRTSAQDVRRHVGPISGRLVDLRLAANTLTASEAMSSAPRAVWNPTLQKFVIATQGAGIGSFYFDDGKADLASAVETRNASSMLYNGANGWVWSWGGNPDPIPLAPTTFALQSPAASGPPSTSGGPGGSSGGGGSTSTSTGSTTLPRLPAPLILPLGGVFSAAHFPGSILIGSGGADPVISVLQYRLNSGPWQPYMAKFSVTPGTRVFARNVAVDPSRYLDSDEDTEVYYKLIDLFTGTVIPAWDNMTGKQNLVKTLNNLLPDNIKATYGKPTAGTTQPNSLEFKRIGFISVPPDTDFKIGAITYYNGTVSGGTEATAIDLDLNMMLTKPTIRSGTAAAHFSLWSSTNTQDDRVSADYAQLDNPRTDFALAIDGVTYTLQLRFANVSAVEGWTDGTKLYVFEGSQGHADLIARFVSSY